MSSRLLGQRSRGKKGSQSASSLPEVNQKGSQRPQLTMMTKEELIQKTVADKRMRSLWGGKQNRAINMQSKSHSSMTEYDEVSKLNFFGSRRHTLKIDTSVPKIVRTRNAELAAPSRNASKEELSGHRAVLEMKIHEFMIEDQILDDQIANAEKREEQEALQKKKEERSQRIAEYKEKLLEQKKAEMRQEEQERLASKKARKPPRAPTSTALATVPAEEQNNELNIDLVHVEERHHSTDLVGSGLKPILKEASSYQRRREEALEQTRGPGNKKKAGQARQKRKKKTRKVCFQLDDGEVVECDKEFRDTAEQTASVNVEAAIDQSINIDIRDAPPEEIFGKTVHSPEFLERRKKQQEKFFNGAEKPAAKKTPT